MNSLLPATGMNIQDRMIARGKDPSGGHECVHVKLTTYKMRQILPVCLTPHRKVLPGRAKHPKCDYKAQYTHIERVVSILVRMQNNWHALCIAYM